MKILFLLSTLHYGGVERQLVVLAKGLREQGHNVVVAVFYSGGPLENELWGAGVRVRPLNKRGRWDVLGFLLRLTKVVREERPDILHSYLFEPNLVAVILKPFSPATRVVWGIASSCLDSKHSDWLDSVSFTLNRWVSKFPDAIISNSEAGRQYHLSLGYPAKNMVVIRNGIDTERFCPNSKARSRIRAEWGVAEREKLIGIVGRLDPFKDHPIFLEAASLLAGKRKDTRFVCVGGGPDDYRAKLETIAMSLGLGERLFWTGTREDMPAVYNALDITVSSSYTEGLPNVIGEAMACGVPCVVTDVGDSAWVVGDQGEVVPPKNPVAIMNAIENLLSRKKYDPAQIRQRVVDQLSASSLVSNTEHVLYALLRGSISNEQLTSRRMKDLKNG